MALLHDDNYAELTLATFVVDFRVFAKGLSRAAELLRRGAEKAFLKWGVCAHKTHGA
jgi:hypothetical protein